MKIDTYTLEKNKKSILLRIIRWAQKNKLRVETLTKNDMQEACRSKPN